MGKMLIVYASKTGTTQDVAVALTEKAGILAELFDCRANTMIGFDGKPVRKQPILAEYCAIVLGTAMHMGAPMKEMKRFVKTHCCELNQKPLAFFTCGVGSWEEDEAYLRKHLPEELVVGEWLYCHMGGEIRLERMSGFARMAMKEYGKQQGCKPSINWEAVDALGHDIETKFGGKVI